MKFSNILFPIDFSDRCRAIAPFVSAVAKRDGATLTLIHVLDNPLIWYETPETSVAAEFSIPHLIEEAEHRLTFFAAELFPGMPVTLIVRDGDPGYLISDEAREANTDLIMMPTRGLGRFRAALLGSVAAKVLHDAECPVWTASHPDKPSATPGPVDWRRITCAIDTSDDALRIIRYARELNQSYAATVHLVHAVPGMPEPLPDRYADRDFDRFLKDSARQTIARLQAEAGTNFDVCVESGKTSSIVASAACSDEADLVLIGRGSITHFGGGLRPQAYSIIRDVGCPVLSV